MKTKAYLFYWCILMWPRNNRCLAVHLFFMICVAWETNCGKAHKKRFHQMINVLLFLSISCSSGADSHFDSLAGVITLTLMPSSIVLPVHLFPRCPRANQSANSCHVRWPTFIFHFSHSDAKLSGKKKMFSSSTEAELRSKTLIFSGERMTLAELLSLLRIVKWKTIFFPSQTLSLRIPWHCWFLSRYKRQSASEWQHVTSRLFFLVFFFGVWQLETMQSLQLKTNDNHT